MAASMTAIRTMKSQWTFGPLLLLLLLLRRPSLCVCSWRLKEVVLVSLSMLLFLLLLLSGLGRVPVSVYYYDC